MAEHPYDMHILGNTTLHGRHKIVHHQHTKKYRQRGQRFACRPRHIYWAWRIAGQDKLHSVLRHDASNHVVRVELTGEGCALAELCLCLTLHGEQKRVLRAWPQTCDQDICASWQPSWTVSRMRLFGCRMQMPRVASVLKARNHAHRAPVNLAVFMPISKHKQMHASPVTGGAAFGPSVALPHCNYWPMLHAVRCSCSWSPQLQTVEPPQAHCCRQPRVGS